MYESYESWMDNETYDLADGPSPEVPEPLDPWSLDDFEDLLPCTRIAA